ncbi:hypothetical protein AAHC03_013453 [Spirometra sp. Aus1]
MSLYVEFAFPLIVGCQFKRCSRFHSVFSFLFCSTFSQLTCGSPAVLKGRDLRELTQAELCPPTESPVEAARPGGQKTPDEVGGEDTEALDVTKGIRTEVIIAGAVVGALIFAFALFIIGYKIHLSRRDKRVRNGPMHQSKRYW